MFNIKNYVKRFYDDFDSIKEVSSETIDVTNFNAKQFTPPPSPKLHYFFGLAIIYYAVIESVIIILKNGISNKNDWKAITNIESLFSHRIFPKIFWHSGDITSIICLGMAITLLTSLCLRPNPTSNQCSLIAIINKNTGNLLKLVDVHGQS